MGDRAEPLRQVSDKEVDQFIDEGIVAGHRVAQTIDPGEADSFFSDSSRAESPSVNRFIRNLLHDFFFVGLGRAPKLARELLLFARLIVTPLADGFVAQPPHEAIERRTSDTQAARSLGPIAFGLGQRSRDPLASRLIEISLSPTSPLPPGPPPGATADPLR